MAISDSCTLLLATYITCLLSTWLVPFRNLESITRAAVDRSTPVEMKLIIAIYGSGNCMYDLFVGGRQSMF